MELQSGRGGRVDLAAPMASDKPSTSVVVLALISTLWLAAACGDASGLFTNSQDRAFHQTGRELIEGELADAIGLGPLQATCEGRDLAPGTPMSCRAVGSSTGVGPIFFDGTIGTDGSTVELTSTNLLLANQVEQIESHAASIVSPRLGQDIEADQIECASTSVVLPTNRKLNCVLEATNQEVRQATVTVEDLASLTITVEVKPPLEEP